MKIAYICQTYPPMISGQSLMLRRLANGMVARGHEIIVCSSSDLGKAYCCETPGLKACFFRSHQNPLRVGQRFAIWPRRETMKMLREFSPDIVHLHDPLAVGLAGLINSHLIGVPVILTAHQLPWFVTANLPDLPGMRASVESLLWVYANAFMDKCDAVIVPTKTIAEIVAAMGSTSAFYISNGINTELFNPTPLRLEEYQSLRKAYDLHPTAPIILHVGRIDREKQVMSILHGAALAMKQTGAQLLVIGDGNQREQLMGLSVELGIRERCHFPGFIENGADLPALYRMSSVFVTASEIETQGLVLLEAAASGLPIVAVNATCIPEVVLDGVNGFLFPPGKEDILADRLITILEEPSRAKAMGKAGRAVAEKHSPMKTIDAHEDLYHHVVAGNPYKASVSRIYCQREKFRLLYEY